MKGALALFVSALAGCSAADVPVRQGERPTIVSLNPCSDAILARVTAPGQLLAVSHYSHDPRATSMNVDAARGYRATGGTVEEVLALSPDMVVASSFLSPAARDAFTGAGIMVETIGTPRTVAGSKAQVRKLAKVAGDASGGRALIAEMDAAIAMFRSNDAALPAVLWQPSGIVPGDGELVSEMMAIAGLSNHSAQRGYGQADYMALEEMLVNPPRVLLIAGGERSQQHPALAALENTHIARIEPNLLFCGGPTIIRAMGAFSAIGREAST